MYMADSFLEYYKGKNSIFLYRVEDDGHSTTSCTPRTVTLEMLGHLATVTKESIHAVVASLANPDATVYSWSTAWCSLVLRPSLP